MSSKEPPLGSKAYLRKTLFETGKLKETSKFAEGGSLKATVMNQKVSNQTPNNSTNAAFQKARIEGIHDHIAPDPVHLNIYDKKPSGVRGAHIAQGAVSSWVQVEREPNTVEPLQVGSTISLSHHTTDKNTNNMTKNSKVPRANQMRASKASVTDASPEAVAAYNLFQSGQVSTAGSSAGAFSGGSGGPMEDPIPDACPEWSQCLDAAQQDTMEPTGVERITRAKRCVLTNQRQIDFIKELRTALDGQGLTKSITLTSGWRDDYNQARVMLNGWAKNGDNWFNGNYGRRPHAKQVLAAFNASGATNEQKIWKAMPYLKQAAEAGERYSPHRDAMGFDISTSPLTVAEIKTLAKTIQLMKDAGWVKSWQTEVVDWKTGTRKKDSDYGKKGDPRNKPFPNEHLHLSIQGKPDGGTDGAID